MKILRTDQFRAARPAPFPEPAGAGARRRAAGGGETLVVFAGWDGAPGRWLLVGAEGVVMRGEAPGAAAPGAARVALAIPGDEVAVHWIELPEGLAPAQAAAAARLQAAELCAQPLSEMHVAAGAVENGRTCVALVPVERMAAWLAEAGADGLDPFLVIPEPLLIPPPETGLVRYDGTEPPAFRGRAAAFAVETELAGVIAADAEVAPIGTGEFEAGLAEALAAPAINLRQSQFARRRQFRIGWGSVRRLAVLGMLLLLATLAVQVAGIMRYTFAADRIEAEASEIGAAGTAAPAHGPGFSAAASLLFDAVRSTPNAELTELIYQAGGNLRAGVTGDTPATLAALRQRIEASGANVREEEARSAGGRAAVDLVVSLP